ncbi:acyl-homoserine-lactone synthase [Vibrio spartinae]|uniref:acyl-homoserine-lactone synthase n=1 Tax=Vibrio spartinae TaxID=1918945 RepID=A0A1N6M7G7_9VIBR|nr:acyl-homoserine-lactone synthase [Vibrio spartinae]QMV14030.1 Acyl-homoserine-lactone synthase LuxM [Vibrio spartinae]SIO95297.1 Acyl-homoserine-lactone synthase LuxM [Vibrio spartinae]
MYLPTSEHPQTDNRIWNQQHIDNFFIEIELQLQKTSEFSGFAELVNRRKQDITQAYPELAHGNLAALFEHPRAIEHTLKSPIPAMIPKFWHDVEIIAIEKFGNLLACWAAYERFLILQRNQPLSFASCPPPPADEYSYQSEIVDRIEIDHRLFLTLHSHIALTLSDAISLINLDIFIIEQKWYEMLFCLHLSQRGSHFILYHTKNTPYPLLVSTALIQHWQERENWLTFDPFFQGDGWYSCLSNETKMHLYKTGLFYNSIMQHVELEFESSFSECIKNTDAVCEVLRLTVSGSKNLRFFLLYLCQKLLMKQLVKYGKKLSFTIIEQPIMLNLYKALDRVCYLNRSYCDINQENVLTYKGFWLNEELGNALSEYNYSEYKFLITGRRKKIEGTKVV